jgi:signal transduction histidine kinase
MIWKYRANAIPEDASIIRSPMDWFARWKARSLASQFLLAGGMVAIVAMAIIGLVVTHLIEDAVIHNSGAASALYVDSVVAPLLPDMQTQLQLDDASARALDETLGQGALGRRLVSFKLWRPDGTILYSNEKDLVGKSFPVEAKLKTALKGKLVARYAIASDPDSGREKSLGKPLMEIYNPVLQPWSGQVVGVLEFYEVADGLGESLSQARILSWLTVAGLTAGFFLILSAIVFRGSRTIETQRTALTMQIEHLSRLLDENRQLQRKLQRSSQRAAALNESYLRSIGADLHDGPAQHIAYASLRLDSDALVDQTTQPEMREKELAWIRSSLSEAMSEIRSICSGLVLPQIEKASVAKIIQRVAEAHAKRTGTRVEIIAEDDDLELADAVKICVYRFVQEALNNAFRHGGGVQQQVSARSSGGGVRVEVSDRGGGFDPTEVRPSSLGLIGMRERVDSLGGNFEVKSGLDGTVVAISFEPMETGDTL